jgi:predicted Zn-dependent protease
MPLGALTEIEPEFNYALEIRETNPLEALNILHDLDRRYPDRASINGVIATTYFTYLKRYDEALPFAQKTVTLSPRSELASLTLFHTLANLGHDEEAMSESGRYIKLNGVSPDYEFLFSEMDDNGFFD